MGGQAKRFHMSRTWSALALTVVLAGSVVAWAPVMAQEKKGPSQSPVGGPAWNAKVSQESAGAGLTLEPAQMATVQKVSEYFNTLVNLRGNFVQTSADNKRLRGKFFVKRPGRLRFEYSLPSKQLIIADGQQLAVQDLDIKTDDRYTIEQTPFRILLKKDVDLIRDARILEVQETEDLVIVSLQDKSPDAPGRIRLFLVKSPALELKEWVTNDAQGLDTRVEVSNLNKTDEIDAAVFKIISPTFGKLQ